MGRRRALRLPAWVRAGARADYHAVLGGPVTSTGCTVATDPVLLGGHTWVVWLGGVSSCVAVEALSRPAVEAHETNDWREP